MKNIILFISIAIFALILSSCSSGTEESADKDVMELKIIERATFVPQADNHLYVLCTDGSVYKEYTLFGHALAQKGDTLVLQNGEIFDVRYRMSED